MAAGVAVAAVVAWRFLQVHGLVLPAWVDSVHHTLLVRILLEQESLPRTWAPYLPSVPFYYHFGFHLSTALFARLTGLTGIELGRAVLYAGQLWQGVLAAGVLVLARRLLRSWDQAIAAVLLVGFVSPMPAFYASWGRYTLLAGLALAAWGMAAALAGRVAWVAVLVAATGVTHYYAFCLLLAFLGLLFLLQRESRLRLAAGVSAGVAAVAPWLFHVWEWSQRLHRPEPPMTGGGAVRETSALALLGPSRNHLLLALAALGLLALVRWRRGVTLTRSRRTAWAFAAWTVALAALLGPWRIGPFRPDHAAIVFFLPTVVLAARGLWALLPRGPAWAALFALTFWGAAESRRIVRADAVLGDAADLEALRWIEDATAPTATLLVDVEPWMGLWRGVDGGWWATPLTGRRTVPPPVAYSWGPPELASLARVTGQRLYDTRRLPGSEYCFALERLFEETGADFYYTRSDRPRSCSNVEAAYSSPAGIVIWTLPGQPRSSAVGP